MRKKLPIIFTFASMICALIGCIGYEETSKSQVLDFHSIGFTGTDTSAVKDGYSVPRYDLYNYDQVCDSAGFSEPRVLKTVAPYYPPEAQQEGITGHVLVRALLSDTGQVLYVAIMKTDNPVFDKYALFAATQDEFLPATCHGKKIQMWIVVPFHFMLH